MNNNKEKKEKKERRKREDAPRQELDVQLNRGESERSAHINSFFHPPPLFRSFLGRKHDQRALSASLILS